MASASIEPSLEWHESEHKDWARLKRQHPVIEQYFRSRPYAQLVAYVNQEADKLYDSDEKRRTVTRKVHRYSHSLEYLKAAHDPAISTYDGADAVRSCVRDVLKPVKRDIPRTLAIRYGFVCITSNRRMDLIEEMVKLIAPDAHVKRQYLS